MYCSHKIHINLECCVCIISFSGPTLLLPPGRPLPFPESLPPFPFPWTEVLLFSSTAMKLFQSLLPVCVLKENIQGDNKTHSPAALSHSFRGLGLSFSFLPSIVTIFHRPYLRETWFPSIPLRLFRYYGIYDKLFWIAPKNSCISWYHFPPKKNK